VKLTVSQTEAAGQKFWIIKDMPPEWNYDGPFEDEATARDFARANYRNF
jgi:hypothetical protein